MFLLIRHGGSGLPDPETPEPEGRDGLTLLDLLIPALLFAARLRSRFMNRRCALLRVFRLPTSPVDNLRTGKPLCSSPASDSLRFTPALADA